MKRLSWERLWPSLREIKQDHGLTSSESLYSSHRQTSRSLCEAVLHEYCHLVLLGGEKASKARDGSTWVARRLHRMSHFDSDCHEIEACITEAEVSKLICARPIDLGQLLEFSSVNFRSNEFTGINQPEVVTLAHWMNRLMMRRPAFGRLMLKPSFRGRVKWIAESIWKRL